MNSIIRSDVNKCSYFWNNRLRIEKWWIQIPAQKKRDREREKERERIWLVLYVTLLGWKEVAIIDR